MKKFYSQKSKTEISYRSNEELRLILQFEHDETVKKIESLLLPIFNSKTLKLIEEAIGFIVHKQNTVSYFVVSDYLSTNRHFANQMKPMITKGKETGEVVILHSSDISDDVSVIH